MKHAAQPSHSNEGQQAYERHASVLQQMEDLSSVTIRNYLSHLHQFKVWCQYSVPEQQDELPFAPPAIASPLLVHYRSTSS